MADLNVVLRGASPQKNVMARGTAALDDPTPKYAPGPVMSKEQPKQSDSMDMKWVYIAGAAVVAWYFLSQ